MVVYAAILWTPEAFPGPNLRFPRKAGLAGQASLASPTLVNKTEISASKKCCSGWDRIRVILSTTLVY